MKYGRLTIIGKEGKAADKHKCLCDCGNITYVKLNSLRTGTTKSCGCLRSEMVSKRFRKHSGKGTPEYNSWVLMRNRCNNPNNKSYSYYGGKGISICQSWDDFTVFFSDMGPRTAENYTLERINNEGDYKPSNCKWATRKEQARNRKNTQMVEFRGEIKPLGEWCEMLNLDYNNTNKRLWRGWDVERAFTEKKRTES